MRYATPRRIQILAASMLTALLAGCTTLPGASRRSNLPPGLSLPPDATAYTTKEWLPGVGRMSESVRRRHRPTGPTESILWVDRFDRADAQLPPQWRAVGSPMVKPARTEDRAGAEITAPPGSTGDCGLQRELQPDQLRGRDVRLKVEVACPSRRRHEALRGVRISLTTTDSSGQVREVFLPFTADLSPGWEPLHWWVRFRSDVGPVILRLRLIQPEAGITISEIDMTAIDSPAEPPDLPPAATRPSGPRMNLIAGGSFETHRRSFFASLLRRWPSDEETPAPLPFEYDNEAVVGEQSLKLLIGTGTGRLDFGPLDLTAAGLREPLTWELKFFARSAKPSTLTASLRTRSQTLDRMPFTLMPEWQSFTGTFTIRDMPADRSVLLSAELVFDIPNRDQSGTMEVWLDGVGLTDVPATEYLQAEPIEVGITGPVPLSADLANIVAEDAAATFGVELSAAPANRPEPSAGNLFGPSPATAPALEAPAGPAGKLALDLLDGWDRSIWARTTEPVLPKTGKYSEKVSFTLPRGYYRLLVSLWTGEPGRSRLISHDECQISVVSFRDPVPMGNRFGLSTTGGNCSGYTTALGAGWVRMDLAAQHVELKPGVWDFAPWQAQLAAARQANLEIVAGVALPVVERFHRTFIEQLLASSPLQPMGLVVSPPAISTRPVDEYLEELRWIAQLLKGTSPQTRLICDLSALDSQTRDRPAAELSREGNLAIGYASTEGGLPENSEPLLEGIGKRYMGDMRVWDLGVPVRLGHVSGNEDWRIMAASRGLEAAAMVQLDPPLDPVLSASRMIRGLLIRGLTGAQLVCCEATALSPSASIYDNDRQWLHDRDLTPRPALVAFERMTSLLNDATLARWIDQAGGCHVLYFEKDDGSVVAAMWRPFGLSPTPLRLVGLPDSITVLDCLGLPEPSKIDGNARVIEVNEMVRYIIAPAAQAKALSDALDAARPPTATPQTKPAK